MAIKETEVWVNHHPITRKHYENKGYKFSKYIDRWGREKVKNDSKILVKIKDLTKSSNIKVTKICDICGYEIPKKQSYYIVIKNKHDGLDRCMDCGIKKSAKTRATANENNCIATTHPEFAELLWNKEDTFKYKYSSKKKLDFKCHNCGNKIRAKWIYDVYVHGVPCSCKDGISYPQKFIFNLLRQLSLKFKTEKTFDWSEKRRYDFYLYELNTLIEVHGLQHYSGKFFETLGGRTAKEEQNNDKFKKSIAIENGILNYLEIDCRKSDLDFIKNSILESQLNNLVDLSKINWLECHKFACNSIIIEVCDLWKEGKKVKEISGKLKISLTTVIKYLKQGKLLDLCDYNPKEEKKNCRKKIVVQLDKNGNYIREWESMSEANRELGIYFGDISNACKGIKQKTAGGYKWMFKDDYEKSISTQM